MKILKIYYHAFRPIALLLGITCIRYLLGNKSVFTIERIFICIIGGLLLGSIFLVIDAFKNKQHNITV